MEFRGTKHVLVGGAGLVGSHTADRLLGEPVREIIILTRPGSAITNLEKVAGDPRVTILIAADVLERDTLELAFEGASGVYHFAAMNLLESEADPEMAFETNVRGTLNVIQACVARKVNRLVFSSSAAVYGDALWEPVTENHPLNAHSFYGSTKIAAEALLRGSHIRNGLSFAALRYTNVYGPRQADRGPYSSVIIKMLKAIETGTGPTIHGDGQNALDLIAAEDCALANICAMHSSANGIYNVATGVKTTLNELAQTLMALSGRDTPIRYSSRGSVRAGRNLICSPDLAVQEIDFIATVSVEKGLQRLIAWRKQQTKERRGSVATGEPRA